MNDHQKNAQYSGVRDGDAPLARNVQPITLVRIDAFDAIDSVVALLDAVL
jgi:hypothetical protein